MTFGADRAQPSAPKASWGNPAHRGGAGRGASRGGSFPMGSPSAPPPAYSPSSPEEVGGEGLLRQAVDQIAPSVPFTNKVTFTNDKVIKVAFVIFLICAVTISVAALIVHYPVVSSAFFTILSLTAGVSLIAIAFQSINNFRKNRKNPTPHQIS